MKVINEKGKLFGVINIVDLLCLLIIALMALGIGWKILGPKVQEAIAPTVEMTTVMRIRGAYKYTLDELERNDIVGQSLVMGTGYVDAKITDLYYEPYIIQVQTADGLIVDGLDPTKKDVILTVTSNVSSGASILKIGTQEVRAGRTFTLKTRTFETIALIDSVIVE